MEKVKRGITNRKIVIENVADSNAPKEVIGLYHNYVTLGECTSSAKFTRISYNGGGHLVNYGLNTFVRDIYILTKNLVIYSDRFGNYYKITDKDVASIIMKSDVHISSEGILLFHNGNQIYATLNCEVGCIENIDSLLNAHISIYNIFSANKKTYIEVSDILTNDKTYYELIFSFNLYEAYGTQISIKANKMCKNISYEDILAGKEINDFEEDSILISDRVLNIFTKNVRLKPLEYKKLLGKKAGCKTRKERIDSEYNISVTTFSYNGDVGVNNCINSFVKNFLIAKPHIATSIWNDGEIRNVLFHFDRFENCITFTDNINDIFNYSENLKLYISLEGVIVAIYTIEKCIYISVSLDGIIWRKYSIKDFVEDSSDIVSASITQKHSKNILTLYEISAGVAKAIQEYIMNFKFDFWSLYNCPVEVDFNIAEF